jgi:hypothetical protein
MDEAMMLEHQLCRGTEFRLITRQNLPEDLARSMVRGLVQFLVVLAQQDAGRELSPPTLIDTAWHEALIDTARYRDFCGEFFGQTLDHHPPISDADFRPENFDLTRRTVELAREAFGNALEKIVWRRSKRVQVLGAAR